MEVTKPYEFIGFGAMDVTKPYKFIGFGAMDVTAVVLLNSRANRGLLGPKRTPQNQTNPPTINKNYPKTPPQTLPQVRASGP